ncbi:MAG TPA: hypothetical protein VMV16_06540 [Solirubrobacteraceae bacterium]|nr:hypothetical protein [Solirubrobacteraceae bacterium]HVC87679.1 hypothetical protein [Gaiellaceae bacterium]
MHRDDLVQPVSSVGGSSIARVRLAGARIDDRFINLGGWGCSGSAGPGGGGVLSGGPEQLAVDSRHIYWVEEARHTIARADLNGTHVDKRFIHFSVTDPSDDEPVTGIAVDSGHIYWVNEDAGGTAKNPVSAIGRARLNGSGVEQRFIVDYRPGPFGYARGAWGGIASDGRNLYWGSTIHCCDVDGAAIRTIARANLDGSRVDVRFIRLASGMGAGLTGLVVAHGRLYWADYDSSKIGSASLDGSNVKTLVHASDVIGLAVDSRHIYWISDINASIGRAALNGAQVKRSFIADGLNPTGIAVGGERLSYR